MHHAQLLIGDREDMLLCVPEQDRTVCPDVTVRHYENCTIADARVLIHEAALRPVVAQERVFVLSFDAITHEAQNALLKLFEEPSVSTRFYLLIPQEDILLPTLRSRLLSMNTQDQEMSISAEVRDFLASSHADRLSQIALHGKNKNTDWFSGIFTGIEIWAHREHDREVLREISFVRTHDRGRSASYKMLLEHLALSLPVVSARS